MTIKQKVSLHGRRAGIDGNDQIIGRGGFVAGGNDKTAIVYPSPDRVAVFDDFIGQALDTGGMWGTIEGADTGADGSMGIVSGAHGGIARLTIPRNTGVAAAAVNDMAALILGRNFHPTQGMRLSARVRLNDTGTTPNGVSVFVGFSDDTGTIEVPMYSDTGFDNDGVHGELAAKASNAFGFLFDTASDTGSGWTADTGDRRWHGVSVAGGTVIAGSVGGDLGASVLQASSGMVTNKWDELEVEFDIDDTGGIARFYLNGVGVGRIDSPVVSTATLTPWIGIANHEVFDTGIGQTSVPSLDIDWVNVVAARDTGD